MEGYGLQLSSVQSSLFDDDNLGKRRKEKEDKNGLLSGLRSQFPSPNLRGGGGFSNQYLKKGFLPRVNEKESGTYCRERSEHAYLFRGLSSESQQPGRNTAACRNEDMTQDSIIIGEKQFATSTFGVTTSCFLLMDFLRGDSFL